MTLHEIEGRLSDLVIEAHELARECKDPVLAYGLRDLADAISDAAKQAWLVAVVLTEH